MALLFPTDAQCAAPLIAMSAEVGSSVPTPHNNKDCAHASLQNYTHTQSCSDFLTDILISVFKRFSFVLAEACFK